MKVKIDTENKLVIVLGEISLPALINELQEMLGDEFYNYKLASELAPISLYNMPGIMELPPWYTTSTNIPPVDNGAKDPDSTDLSA